MYVFRVDTHPPLQSYTFCFKFLGIFDIRSLWWEIPPPVGGVHHNQFSNPCARWALKVRHIDREIGSARNVQVKISKSLLIKSFLVYVLINTFLKGFMTISVYSQIKIYVSRYLPPPPRHLWILMPNPCGRNPWGGGDLTYIKNFCEWCQGAGDICLHPYLGYNHNIFHPGPAPATCRSTKILPVTCTKMSIKSFTIEIFQF